jgi:glycerol-3-phosphate acyltransferase PlsY
VTALLVKAVLAYLAGSIVGSLLVGRLRGGIDIRRLGSGNAGGTNALRTQGRLFAFWVLLIDIGKGWVATAPIAGARLPGLAEGNPRLAGWTVAACGLAVILGHIYPLWHGFRGGKGVATLLGAALGASPMLLVPAVIVWLLTVMLFGFVGLASILGAASLAAAAAAGPAPHRAPLIAFGLLSAALITFTHRSNIARMLGGTEPRVRRLWLFRGARDRRT